MDVRSLIGIDNPHALKFWAMGFVLREVEIRDLPYGPQDNTFRNHFGYWYVQGCFECVCGRREMFRQTFNVGDIELSPAAKRATNVYAMLDRFGSMDRQHLIEDGYDPVVVDEMVIRGSNVALGSAVAFAAMRSMDFRDQSIARLSSAFDHRGTYTQAMELFKSQAAHPAMRPMPSVFDSFPGRY